MRVVWVVSLTPAQDELFSLTYPGIYFVYAKTGSNRVPHFYETTLRSCPVRRLPFYCTCSHRDVIQPDSPVGKSGGRAVCGLPSAQLSQAKKIDSSVKTIGFVCVSSRGYLRFSPKFEGNIAPKRTHCGVVSSPGESPEISLSDRLIIAQIAVERIFARV